jgi:peptidoglycan-associated lipoprotein
MSRHRLIVGILVLGLVTSACAKRPAGTAASAPPPGGGAAAGDTAKAPGGAAGSEGTRPGSPPATTQRAPGEFVENAALKDIHFDFDKSDIRTGDAKILDANAGWLKANPNQVILIEGHCDERGTNEYNLALGERRAKATQNYLVSQGIGARRITVISYGEERPLCKEQSETCWEKNRRSHFLTKRE